jgi:uncharacterized protein YndB with AHSA1/START domain
MNKPSFIYISYINTTPEELWSALTGPEFSRQYWFGYAIESDWKVGSDFKLVGADGNIADIGKVLVVEKPKILSYTFSPQGREEWKNELPSTVKFELEVDGQMVKLTVSHFDFPENSVVFKSITQGWPAILSSLKSLLETGKALSFE